MRELPPGMQDHLDAGATTLCRCWRLTRADGLVLGFTDHDESLSFDGTLFEAATGFQASETVSGLGLSVDNTDIEGALSSESLNETALSAGLFDNASVEVFIVNWAAINQRLLLRKGHVGEVRRSENAFIAEIRGLAHELNQPQGRLYQYSCDADLGDARCSVDLELAAFKASAGVAQVESRKRFVAEGLDTFADDWFSRGALRWASGANSGGRMEIRGHYRSGGDVYLDLWHPMSANIAPGDTFTIYAGCDKQPGTCRLKFNNMENYRGFPQMPGNDFAVSYPVRGEGRNDGSSLQS